MSNRYYWILDDQGNPVEVRDLEVWAKWFEKTDRHLGSDKIGGIHVSTVFLGLDHGFSLDEKAPPVLWETMIFGGEHDGYQERYSSKEEALAGHTRAVEMVIGSDGFLSELKRIVRFED